MANSHAQRGRQVFSDINITPLTDIFLVLLIVMMVVAPALMRVTKDIKPPRISEGNPLDQKTLTVEVAQDGKYYVDGQDIVPNDLENLLKAKATNLEKKNLVVRGDRATKSQSILRVLRLARDAGFGSVTVAGQVEPLSKGPVAVPETGSDPAKESPR